MFVLTSRAAASRLTVTFFVSDLLTLVCLAAKPEKPETGPLTTLDAQSADKLEVYPS